MNFESPENKSEKTYDYWVDTASLAKRALEDFSQNDLEDENQLESMLKAYEDAIDELKARKDSFTGTLIEDHVEELINEFEEKKKSFQEKFQ